MLASGSALTGAEPYEGELCFWGEWEPQAVRVATRLPTGPSLPTRIWKPFYDLAGAPANRLNTDPLVFGGFRYTVCQQHRRIRGIWRPTRLHDLGVGSVILFGSHMGGAFVLDTVFVVANAHPHNSNNYRRLPVPQAYFDVTVNTIYSGDSGSSCCKPAAPGDEYVLYEGATSAAPIAGMFSFVPCQPWDSSTVFARPHIHVDGMSQGQSQGFGVPIHGDLDRISTAWRSVRDQVLRAGLHLGTALDMPKRVAGGANLK